MTFSSNVSELKNIVRCRSIKVFTNSSDLILGITYRSTDSKLNEFLSGLDLVLGKFSKKNKLVFLKGDWNLNIIDHYHHKATSDFLDLLYSGMFFPLITRPTRIDCEQSFVDR